MGVIEDGDRIVTSTKKAACVNCDNLTLSDTMFFVELVSGESGLVCTICHPKVMAAGCLVAKSRLHKLPKWAQARIKLLQANLEFAEEKLRQITTGDTPIRWERSPKRDAWHGIPARAILRFDLTRGTVEATLREGVLRLRNYGHGRIVVKSDTYNGIDIDIEPRHVFEMDALLQSLRKLEAEDTYADMNDSGIVKCNRCDIPVGEAHLIHCPYNILPRLAS